MQMSDNDASCLACIGVHFIALLVKYASRQAQRPGLNLLMRMTAAFLFFPVPVTRLKDGFIAKSFKIAFCHENISENRRSYTYMQVFLHLYSCKQPNIKRLHNSVPKESNLEELEPI